MPKTSEKKFNPYEVLEVAPGSSLKQIKEAYVRLILKHHPDKHQQKPQKKREQAEARFKEIQLAYELLTKSNLNSSAYNYDLEEVGEGAIVPFGEENHHELTPEEIELFISDGNNLSESSKVTTSCSIDIKNDSTNLKNINKNNYLNEIIESIFKISKKGELCDRLDKDEIEDLINEQIKHYETINENVREKAFLWKAEKEGAAPIYIFSTIHKSTMDIKDILGDAINNIVDQVDDVFTETKVNTSNLKEHPLNNKHKDEKKTDVGMDDFIAQISLEMDKNLRYLENIEVITSAGIDMDALFKEFANNTKKEDSQALEQFTQNYLTHISSEDDKSLFSDPDSPHVKRNLFWIKPILETSQAQKSCLVVCGSGHNVGKFGLPNLLAHNGYQLRPLMKVPPIPKSTLIRDAYLSSGGSGFFKKDAKGKELVNAQQKDTKHNPMK